MRSYEFIANNVIDIEKRSCIGLEQAIIKTSRKTRNFIYEDLQDVKNYKSTIENEKQYTISYSNLVQGNIYCPLSLRGAPYQQTVYIDIPETDIEFVGINGVDLQFNDGNNIIKFRVTKNSAIGTLETLIFASKSEADHFITLLKTKFSEWYIPIRTRF